MHIQINGIVRWVRKVEIVFFLLVAAVVGVWIFSAIVPFNMDEFIHYNTLICALHPFSRADEACREFVLNFLNTGLILPLRAYHYAGSFPVLYYLPLFLLWPHPLSARFLGLLFLVGGGVLLAREFGLRKRATVGLLLLFFPYAFQHIVDTGPVGFHIMSVYLFYICARRWARTLRLRWVLSMTAMVFFGIWTKFSYFWLLPGLGMILLLLCAEEGMLRWRWWQWREVSHQGAIAILLLSIGVGALLLSAHPDDLRAHPYLEQLLQSEARSMGDFLSGEWLTSGVVRALLNPMETLWRVYEVPPANGLTMAYSILLYLTVPLGIAGIVLLRLPVERRALVRAGVLYSGFLIVAWMIIRTRGAWSMHHAVLAYPFLILSVCALIGGIQAVPMAWQNRRIVWKASRIVLYSFIALNTVWYVRVPFQHATYAEHASRRAIHAVLSDPIIARQYVMVVVDWGVYYEQGLFGDPQQSMLFWWGMQEPQQVEKLRLLAERYGRKVLFVYTQPDTAANINLLHQEFALEPCVATGLSDRWQILAEPDAEFRRACTSVAHTVHRRGSVLASLLPNMSFTME